MKANKANKKYRTGKVSYIFTKETLGMSILLFCAIVLLMLFTGKSVFYGIGSAVCEFMYGSFGYGSLLIVFLLGYLGEILVFEKKIPVKLSIALAATGLVFSLFLLVHAITTSGMGLQGFGSYLNGCYNNAKLGWQGYTFGGAVCGIVVYPIAKFTTFVGAYIIFSVLTLLFAYMLFIAINKSLPEKVKDEASISTAAHEGVEENYTAEPAPTATNDHLYAVGEGQEIVDTRSYVPETPPAPPVMADTPVPEDEDKFSIKNLGRKILFENDEFAAESYRRNMIFSEDSYYSHPVTTQQDYLASFSQDPDKYKSTSTPSGQTYTEAYQQEVSERPERETPNNYVYGDTPASQIGEEYSADHTRPVEPYRGDMPEEKEELPSNTAAEEEDDGTVIGYSEPTYTDRPSPVDRTPRFEERPSADRREETPPVPPAEENKRDIPDTPMFGGSRRGERMDDVPEMPERGDRTDRTERERSNANLFDDDDDDSVDDVFGTSRGGRDGLSDRGGRDAFTGRLDRNAGGAEEIKPRGDDLGPADPPRGRDVGFGIPSAERRGRETAPVPEPQPQPQPKPEEKPKHVWKKYIRPTLDLLDDYPEGNNVNSNEIEDNKQLIVETLASFKIGCEISNVTVGPALTRYDVIIDDNLNIRRSLTHKDAIAMALKKENVNIYLNFGKGALSIEVPNNKRTIVGLKTMLTSPQFINSKPNSITVGLGKNIDGEIICPDITKMPHLLVAGATGSGKSICLRTILMSLLYKYGPEELRLILVDPKQVEFIPYDKLPHLMINEIIFDIDKAIKALNWAIKEMERRYALFKDRSAKGLATTNLDEYNSSLQEGEEKLPKIIIILDEFGDLMLQAKKDIEGKIIKLVQKSRACGIHLILATQRPSVDCITGMIKSNLPTRIGFKVGSFTDSTTIFDVGGAEKLLGEGDMFFRSAAKPDLVRIQGCFASSKELQRVTDFVKEHNETYFDQEAAEFINKVEEPEAASSGAGDLGDDGGDSKIDDTFIKALKFCITSNQASVSMLQRRFPVGYIKACKIIDWMANMNYITQPEGSKPRKVLLTKEEFINIYGDVDD